MMSEADNDEAALQPRVKVPQLIKELKKINQYVDGMNRDDMVKVTQMVEELQNISLYEHGMSHEQMIKVLNFVKESETSANQRGPKKDVNKTPEATRVDNQASNSRSSNRESMSPELSGSQIKKSLSQSKRNDSGDEMLSSSQSKKMFNKENKNLQQPNINKNRNTINESTSATNDNKHLPAQRMNLLQRIDEPLKYKVNPLDVIYNPNDVPLQSRFYDRPEKDISHFVSVDKVLDTLGIHMQQIAEQYYNPQGNTKKNSDSWGKAIQVGTANGSMDRNSIRDEDDSEDAGPSREINTNIDIDKFSRRRGCTIKNINYASSQNIEDNSDDDVHLPLSSTRKSINRAETSEKTSLQKLIVDKTRRRGNIYNTDDFIDKNLMIETNDEDNQQDENTKKAIKRAGSSEKNDQPWESIIDENDTDEENEISPKKMKPTISLSVTKKISTTRNIRQKSVETASSNAPEKGEEALTYFDDGDDVTMIYDDDTNRKESLQKPKKTFSEDNISGTLQKLHKNLSEEAVSSTSSSYPRRIVPPPLNTGFKKFMENFTKFNNLRSTRDNKKLDNDNKESKKGKNRSNVGLEESEIKEALENNDDVDVEEVSAVADLAEIRPLRMRVTNSMKIQAERLKMERKEAEYKELQLAEEKRIKEEEDDREKQTRVHKRLQKHNAELRSEAQKVKAQAETEKRWNRRLDQQTSRKYQSGRTELNPDGPRQNNDHPTVEIQQDNLDTEPDDDQGSSSQNSERVSCPICCKKFSAQQIEDHAASCEEYDATSSTGASRSNSPSYLRSKTPLLRLTPHKYNCEVCSAFSTYEGKKYEDHVSKCIASCGTNQTTSTTIDIPDSPVQTFRRISELSDSEVDYHNEFVRKTKSRVNDSRKRKRN